MPRERQDYRDILEDILAFTGGKRMLCISDVVRYTGHSAKTVKKKWPEFKEGVTAPTLARALCRL